MARGDVEVIHEGVIELGGGAHGLRDPALLEPALARPQNLLCCSDIICMVFFSKIS